MIISIYEDPDLVREQMTQEALEEATVSKTNPFIPTGFEALIDQIAEAKVKDRPERKARRSLLTSSTSLVEQGELPPPIQIKSERNASYQRHMDKLHGYAQAGLRTALEDYPLSGTNTYAKAVRSYRDLLLKWLDTKSGAATITAAAQPDAPAKKSSTGKATKQATSATNAARPKAAKAQAEKSRKAPAKKK